VWYSKTSCSNLLTLIHLILSFPDPKFSRKSSASSHPMTRLLTTTSHSRLFTANASTDPPSMPFPQTRAPVVVVITSHQALESCTSSTAYVRVETMKRTALVNVRSVLGWMSGEVEGSVVGGSKRLMEWFSLAGSFEHGYTCVSRDDASFGRRLGGGLGCVGRYFCAGLCFRIDGDC
jgi:hypothetical protein